MGKKLRFQCDIPDNLAPQGSHAPGKPLNFKSLEGALGSRGGAVVRALASHQCVLGSIPGPGAICGLSLLLVLALL